MSSWLTRLRAPMLVLCALALVASACRVAVDTTDAGSEFAQSSERLGPVPTPTPAPDPNANPFSDRQVGGGIDFRLRRDDIDCQNIDLATREETPATTAHYVVDGNLGDPCLGALDARLISAWMVLVDITPPGQLHDLAMFTGYESTESSETTLAFVNTIDDDGELYQMAINLAEADADPDELRLTMAHEFSHVFTTLPSQIDRAVWAKDCDTWSNGDGCFLEGSLMWEWIQLFWSPGMLYQVDPFTPPSRGEGLVRCRTNAGFLGPYSASSPEEDFAESFSAFVFQVPVQAPELKAKMAWFESQPGLAEFRSLAIESGYGPQQNTFPACG